MNTLACREDARKMIGIEGPTVSRLYAEEDWDCPEQTEIDKEIQPDFPLTMKAHQSKKGRSKKKYNPYGEDFVIDMIVLSDLKDSLVRLDEITVPREIGK